MDFVVAVKALPDRKVIKSDKVDYITLVLSNSEEAADKDILHRDKAYLSKLQGLCFTCNKLNANPPQDVCERPPPDGRRPPRCENYDDPCLCFNCPPPPDNRDCLDGYPSPLQGLQQGSGYWVGLQANSYYSNFISGGWLVAVTCSGGEVLGAFPVSTQYFGYGRGEIAGTEVMVYPAGVAYGAGLSPFQNSSFPILGLTQAEGDEIASTNFNITTSSFTPGDFNPENIAYAEYFCSAENGSQAISTTINCLRKYGDGNCPDFKDYEVGPADQISPSASKTLNIANVRDQLTFTLVSGSYQANATMVFANDNGAQYCAVSTMVLQPSDAISPCTDDVSDPPIAVADDCKSCVSEPINCEFLMNNFKGSYQQPYSGFNSAADDDLNSYHAIGPNSPPRFDSDSVLISGSGDFWTDNWGWNPTTDIHLYDTGQIDAEGNSIILKYVIAPISTLYDNCKCADGKTEKQTTTMSFIEGFTPCNACDGDQTLLNNIQTQKGLIFGSGTSFRQPCSKCVPNCISPKCANNTDGCQTELGTGIGYIPCIACKGNLSNFGIDEAEALQKYSSVPIDSSDSGIEVSGGRGTAGHQIAPNLQYCHEVYRSLSNNCGPCKNTNLKQLDNSGNYILNEEGLNDCANHNLDDDCFKEKYLPRFYKNHTLEFEEISENEQPTINNNGQTYGTLPPNDFYLFSQYVKVIDPNDNSYQKAYEIVKDFTSSNDPGPLSNNKTCDKQISAYFGFCACKKEKTTTITNNCTNQLVPKTVLDIIIVGPGGESGICKDCSEDPNTPIEPQPIDPCGCCVKTPDVSASGGSYGGSDNQEGGSDCPACCLEPGFPNNCQADPDNPSIKKDCASSNTFL